MEPQVCCSSSSIHHHRAMQHQRSSRGLSLEGDESGRFHEDLGLEPPLLELLVKDLNAHAVELEGVDKLWLGAELLGSPGAVHGSVDEDLTETR